MSTADDRFMALALEQARLAVGRTHPNPAVGAVLVKAGKVVGRGYTQPVGGPHAEVEALREAGAKAKGATLYSTLEPCSHHGRTPPCADAIIAAGVSRVVYAAPDPNPLVNGRGAKRLKTAGVKVTAGPGLDEAQALNRPFHVFITQQRAFVTLKVAVTLDGKLATENGDSKWITSEPARRRVHEWRNQVDAVLVGAKTVAADDPRLTTRLPGGNGRDPVRIVLDDKLTAPPRATVFRTAKKTRTIVATRQSLESGRAKAMLLRGVEVWRVKSLKALLERLAEEGLIHLLVEGGATVHAGFLKTGLFDELKVFVAPKLIGHRGRTWTGGLHAETIAEALKVGITSTELIGDDVLITAVPTPHSS